MHAKGKAFCVLQGAAGIILQFIGQFYAVAGIGVKRGLERDSADCGGVFVIPKIWALAGAIGADQRDFTGHGGGNGGAEANLHTHHRQARRIGISALATKTGAKGRAGSKFQDLLMIGNQTRGGGNAFAPDQRQPGCRGQGALATHRADHIFALFGWLIARAQQTAIAIAKGAQGRHRLFTLVTTKDVHRDLLANAFYGAIRVLLDRLRRGRSIQSQKENLVFINAAIAFIGLCIRNIWAASVEHIGLFARYTYAVQGFDIGFQGEGTTHTAWQIMVKIINPVTVIGPAATAFGRTVNRKGAFLAGVTKAGHGGGKTHSHLADVFDGALG